MRGIISAAGYVPYRRLSRGDIATFMGSGGGKGTRAVASHDEDTTTLGVEAARLALRGAAGSTPESLWFATSQPAYLDKTNATAIAAALRLPGDVGAFDFGGALRSGMGALVTALSGGGTTLVVASDTRDGLPTSGDESAGGDAGAAVVVGEGSGVIAEFVAAASATDEFTDRWRAPGDRTSKLWEERFGENRYIALGQEALGAGDEGRRCGVRRHRAVGHHGDARPCRGGIGEEAGARRGGGWPTTSARAWARAGRRIRCWSWPSTLEALAAEGAPAGHGRGARASGRRGRRRRAADDRCARAWRPARPGGGAGGRRRADHVRQVPVVAGPAAARAATAAGAGAGVEHGGAPERGVEVRLRRFEGPELGGGAHAALEGVDGRRRGRRHGARADGRRRGDGRHVHGGPAGVLAEPADRVRHRRLRRRRPVPGRADRRRRRRGARRAAGSR